MRLMRRTHRARAQALTPGSHLGLLLQRLARAPYARLAGLVLSLLIICTFFTINRPIP